MPAKQQTLVATETFVTRAGGAEYVFIKDETRVSSDHPAAKAVPQNFKPVEDGLLEVEQATKAPGEKRGRKK